MPYFYFRKTKAHPLFKSIPYISLNGIEHACKVEVAFYFSELNFHKGMTYSSKYGKIFLLDHHTVPGKDGMRAKNEVEISGTDLKSSLIKIRKYIQLED